MNRFWFILSLLLVVGCSNSKKKMIEDAPLITRTFTDDLGRQIKLSRTPVRIVSLAPSCTEMLFAIGAQDKMIARSAYCDYPIDALDLPGVVTYPELDLPAIAEFKPDLVLTTDEIADVKQADFFDRYGIPLYFQSFSGLSDINRNIRALGDMLDLKANANALADSLASIEKTIIDSTQGKIKYRTMVLIGIKPIIVAGGGSFISEVVEKAGGTNAFGNSDEKYPLVNEEAILKMNPEVILIPSSNDQIYQEFAEAHPVLHLNMQASQNGRVYLMAPNLVLRPGPRTVEGMAYLARTLHSSLDITDLFE